MLRITIELVPGGREEGAKVIGRGEIGNVSALAELSDYVCRFEENPWEGRTRGPHFATLSKWPRNERGAWQIVHAALSVALGSPSAKTKDASKKPKRSSASRTPRRGASR